MKKGHSKCNRLYCGIQFFHRFAFVDAFIQLESHQIHNNFCLACSSYIAHEANTESVFSSDSKLSDSKQNPRHQQRIVRFERNHAANNSDWETVFTRNRCEFRSPVKNLQQAVQHAHAHQYIRTSSQKFTRSYSCTQIENIHKHVYRHHL